MDTTQAIEILQTESLNLGVDIGTKTNLKAALDLAVEQLQGTLKVQLTELEDAKTQLATANETITTLQAAPVAEETAVTTDPATSVQ
jgi:hypothetical protein